MKMTKPSTLGRDATKEKKQNRGHHPTEGMSLERADFLEGIKANGADHKEGQHIDKHQGRRWKPPNAYIPGECIR